MIDIQVELVCIPLKNGNEYYHYEKFNVNGHANDGTINSIKCCAGVTAILVGLPSQFITNNYIIEKGNFEYWCNETDISRWDTQTDFALNCALYQLWEVYHMYPSLFKSFKIIEVKGDYINYARKIRNKINYERPSSKRKWQSVGVLTCCEEPNYQEIGQSNSIKD